MTLFLSWFLINSIKFISVLTSTLIYSFSCQFSMPIQCHFLIAVTFISIFISHHFHFYFRVISTFCWAVNLATECSSITAALNLLLQACPSVLLVTAGTWPALFHSVIRHRADGFVARHPAVVLRHAAPVPHRCIPHRALLSMSCLTHAAVSRVGTVCPHYGK
jgi:hypothetical protein